VTHWATWDAPRYKRFIVAACGAHCRERELVVPGQVPTCPICFRHYREFETLNIGE
jgi:hypothetical protein